MVKRILFIAILIATLGSPFATHAVTQAELLAQIDSLLKLVLDLQNRVRALGGESPATPPTSIATTGLLLPSDYDVCIRPITRTLARGSQGDDVLALQEFLRAYAAYTGELGGYFGELTERAVREYQTTQGIITSGYPETTGFGVVGPRTRLSITTFCNTAQRTVPVTPTVTSPVTPAQGTHCPTVPTLPQNFCTGTHTPHAAYGSDACQTGWICKTPTVTTATTTATTTTTTTCGSEYIPVCARIPITCPAGATCTEQSPITFSNSCFMNLSSAILVSQGACPAPTQATPQNRAPLIESISGPTDLAPNEHGSWTILASDPDGDTLQYKIVWGDEQTTGGFNAINNLAQSDVYSASRAYTHAYALSGTYTIRAKVRDTKGLETEKTLSVRVGGGSGQCYSNITLYPAGTTRACITRDGGGGTVCAPENFVYICQSNEWQLRQL